MLYISRPLSSSEPKGYFNSEYNAAISRSFTDDASKPSDPSRKSSVEDGSRNDEGFRKHAGWDFTFSSHKTVSITALLGKDEQIRHAHERAVVAALREAEKYVQARIDNGRVQTTGNWVTAVFHHDTAIPFGCYPGPHLHTHVVVFNMTKDSKGKVREIYPFSLYNGQGLFKAIYHSDMAHSLRAFGYPLRFGPMGEPEIEGYTEEYLANANIKVQPNA